MSTVSQSRDSVSSSHIHFYRYTIKVFEVDADHLTFLNFCDLLSVS